ncbi:MAG: cation transporter [Zoogloea sp.]|nr:cation transporter [Zoogloea sp.]
MSSSVSISIVTNTLIAASKLVGWLATGSPTLFAESIHSGADVANQVLLRVGEVRSRGGASERHPFGSGQERFFWALVSAVSVFFVGCGVTLYHGILSLFSPGEIEPFTPFVFGLLLFSLALESFTFRTAWKEIGGWAGLKASRSNTTVLAVLLEDAVALAGIALTLLVAGVSLMWGPQPELDAAVSIVVALMLGTMALFLANLNRGLLIDVADDGLNRALAAEMARREVVARVSSLTVDIDRYVAFIRVAPVSAARVRAHTWEIGEQLKQHARDVLGKTLDSVYWKFPGERP